MTNRGWIVGGLAVAVLLATARADDNPFAAYEKAGKPGAEHKKLEPIVGNWTWTGKFSMPDGKSVESTGKAKRNWAARSASSRAPA